MSIFDNIAYGLKLKGIKKTADQSALVEKASNMRICGRGEGQTQVKRL